LQYKFAVLGLVGLTVVAIVQQVFYPDTSPWIVGALLASWLLAAMALTGMSLSDYKIVALVWLSAACGIAIGYGVYGSTSKVWAGLGVLIAVIGIRIFRRDSGA
jgi:hypothetical protein